MCCDWRNALFSLKSVNSSLFNFGQWQVVEYPLKTCMSETCGDLVKVIVRFLFVIKYNLSRSLALSRCGQRFINFSFAYAHPLTFIPSSLSFISLSPAFRSSFCPSPFVNHPALSFYICIYLCLSVHQFYFALCLSPSQSVEANPENQNTIAQITDRRFGRTNLIIYGPSWAQKKRTSPQ